ncbi:MAG: DNA repair ATPase, partial [Planctomycetota bacterium]
MTENNRNDAPAEGEGEVQLQGGTYEIIRNRLTGHAKELSARMQKLNNARADVFGAVENKLLSSKRISTKNNCTPRDMIPVGDKFIFGYNVFVGLRTETTFEDVFSVYQWKDGSFTSCPPDLIADERFEADFQHLYRFYRHTKFAKFAVIGKHLFMVFRVGKSISDVKTFKWLIRESSIEYLDNRSDHEYVYPSQHEFEWRRVTQDMHRRGRNPHASIEDRVFVETIGGDLTVKIEDNTETGEGIYAEPVDDPDQTLNDAEIYYAIVGNVILMKIRPYQEQQFRYIVYNEKLQKALRLDAIKDSCVLLPEDHGLVFPKGYYLQTGALKQFETEMEDMVFEKRITSPNGEDYLYVFYNRDSGVYILLSYNIIEQQVNTPVLCNGYSFFDDGTLIYFKADDEAKKHHAIQIWQTPYYGPDYSIEVKSDSELYKIGNKDIVTCMAECHELINLVAREEVYSGLYLEVANRAEEITDSYFWIGSEDTFKLSEPLGQIREAASAAVDEFEKVVRTKRNTGLQIEQVAQKVQEIIGSIDYEQLNEINTFVEHLSKLRSTRGEVISLKDLQYADVETIESIENDIVEHTDKLSELCAQFLLDEQSLAPYRENIKRSADKVPEVRKAAEAKELDVEVEETAKELEMLTDIVSNLKIADATETIAIIDNISLVYSQVNQVKSSLKNKLKELGRAEGQAEFGSQLKLLEQSVVNYLDVCSTSEKCDEYLTKATVQLETLESKFADFEEFIVQLAEKREEVYNAFESRKVQLVAERSQRTSALMTSADRILKGIRNRIQNLTGIDEINGYFASDLMIDRIRETVQQLIDLDDNVKAEDLRNKLKTIHQDAIRQLKDKQALYEDGENIIRLGGHRFAVNRQALEGTIVRKDQDMYFHLTGTGFFERIINEQLNETRDVWDSAIVSETEDVYRAEYLAHKLLRESEGPNDEVAPLGESDLDAILGRVQEFMGPRYDEGYIKGVHDQDAARILQALLQLGSRIGLLRYSTQARALATVFWKLSDDREHKQLLNAKTKSMGQASELFGYNDKKEQYIEEIENHLVRFVENTELFDVDLVDEAAEYLFYELAGDNKFVVDKCAADLRKEFESHIDQKQYSPTFAESLDSLSQEPLSNYRLLRDWVYSYTLGACDASMIEYVDEVATLLLPGNCDDRITLDESITTSIADMVGDHPLINEGKYNLNYCHFMKKLRRHEKRFVPRFRQYHKCRNELVETYSRELHLDEFQPHVLTTFVRNKLIDQIYLPLIGDNLAKQIGAEGAGKRTDRQGLLLLISPPGYGKTTLMEYMANRLGLIFIKINGPAIGNKVLSVDPAEAPNAASREELAKLNLAFEMGDNIMIYVDDIQHTNPEFLQKFISLCDAQRKVEGVYKGRSKTYDLRGKRVCVVMAGNPYTESGERFRIPDMLANRADVYNIGDIVGDNYDQFVASYIENSLTSNPVLEKLARRSQNDVYAIMRVAETGQQEGIEFEDSYSAEELNEHLATMKKLYMVRDIVLKVNQQYIRSAGQAEQYRTEPPFLLQGSYRNMNRIAGRVLPIMNEEELWTLIYSTYEQDAQTLTTGTESNLLKFRELTGRLTPEQAQRWEEIKKTFGRNLLLGGDAEDNVGKIVRQLNAF